jgi:hypothetical protein
MNFSFFAVFLGVQYLHFSIAGGDPFAAEWYRGMMMEEQKICYMVIRAGNHPEGCLLVINELILG